MFGVRFGSIAEVFGSIDSLTMPGNFLIRKSANSWGSPHGLQWDGKSFVYNIIVLIAMQKDKKIYTWLHI